MLTIGATPKPTKLCGICASVYKYAWSRKLHIFTQSIWANENHIKYKLLNP